MFPRLEATPAQEQLKSKARRKKKGNPAGGRRSKPFRSVQSAVRQRQKKRESHFPGEKERNDAYKPLRERMKEGREGKRLRKRSKGETGALYIGGRNS